MEARQTQHGRVYATPVGDLPSVTTILSRKLNNKKLDEWKRRVGQKESDRISGHAATQGLFIHAVCENYLLGKTEGFNLMPTNLAMFLQVKTILDKNISKIYGIELPLWSAILGVAGRADALVEWKGRNVVLDFKTSTKQLDLSDERVVKYNLQTTTYAMMAEEMYKIEFPYNVIIVIPKDLDFPQVIVKTNKSYHSVVQEIFK
jgi:hypothetical protein